MCGRPHEGAPRRRAARLGLGRRGGRTPRTTAAAAAAALDVAGDVAASGRAGVLWLLALVAGTGRLLLRVRLRWGLLLLGAVRTAATSVSAAARAAAWAATVATATAAAEAATPALPARHSAVAKAAVLSVVAVGNLRAHLLAGHKPGAVGGDADDVPGNGRGVATCAAVEEEVAVEVVAKRLVPAEVEKDVVGLRLGRKQLVDGRPPGCHVVAEVVGFDGTAADALLQLLEPIVDDTKPRAGSVDRGGLPVGVGVLGESAGKLRVVADGVGARLDGVRAAGAQPGREVVPTDGGVADENGVVGRAAKLVLHGAALGQAGVQVVLAAPADVWVGIVAGGRPATAGRDRRDGGHRGPGTTIAACSAGPIGRPIGVVRGWRLIAAARQVVPGWQGRGTCQIL